MNKSIRRSRRHHNLQNIEGEHRKPFFSKSDAKVQKKEENHFFQPKLEVSPSNDPTEKEADAKANQVIQNTHQIATDVQRKEKVSRQVEEEEPQTKSEVQRQAEEDETQASLEVQRQAEEEEMQTKLEIQRQAEEEEPQAKLEIQKQESQDEEQLQTKKEPSSQSDQITDKKKGETDPSRIEQLIEKTMGQGFVLPDDIRQEMEAQFEADFSAVRIHTSPDAIRMNKMLGAQAFTHGYNIYFTKGKYNPYTDIGKNLLAHELTHVVQQKGK